MLKRGVLANPALASFAHLVRVIRRGLKKIQYQSGLIDGCLAETGLCVDQTGHRAGVTNQRSWLNTAGRAPKDLRARMLGDRPMRGTPPWRHPGDRAVYGTGNRPEVRQIR